MVFDKSYFEYFIANKKKFDQYEAIAIQRTIKYYNGIYILLNICNTYEYDFQLSNNKRYEVKAEPYSITSNNFYIEYFDNFNKRPSGIATTTADYYIITDTLDNYYMIKTTKLRTLCKQYPSRINRFNTATGYIVPTCIICSNAIVI